MSNADAAPAGQAPQPPLLTVTRGSATATEIAVLTAVLLAARSAAAAPQPAPRRPAWPQAGRLRQPLPSSWRASALPC